MAMCTLRNSSYDNLARKIDTLSHTHKTQSFAAIHEGSEKKRWQIYMIIKQKMHRLTKIRQDGNGDEMQEIKRMKEISEKSEREKKK